MATTAIKDFLSVLEIASHLHKGKHKEAYTLATNLDTYVRESLPRDFWKEWILPMDAEIHNAPVPKKKSPR